MPEKILFYAVKTNGEWEILDRTEAQMVALTNDDRTLGRRMASHPFNSRAEAESWVADRRTKEP